MSARYHFVHQRWCTSCNASYVQADAIVLALRQTTFFV